MEKLLVSCFFENAAKFERKEARGIFLVPLFAMKILFVEDNARFAKLAMAQVLSQHDVVLVASIAQALEMLRSQTFDAVLIDFDLSDGKGPIVAQTASELVPKPFVVAVSSHEEGNAQLMAAGAEAICSKMRFSNIISVLETRFGASGPF
jgi:CheY-like chemotaxis protein